MSTKIQIRRDTAANWTANNPVLSSWEQGLETDTNKIKYWNWADDWNTLSYYSDESKLNKVQTYTALTELNLNDEILLYRPDDWTTYKCTVETLLNTSTWPVYPVQPTWAITSATWSWADISPDWTKIIYRHSSWFIYEKNADDTGDWVAINSLALHSSGWSPKYSPDWTEIIYTDSTNRYIYKKSASDTSNWTAITSQISAYPSWSPDWTEIVYSWFTWAAFELHKKNSTDTANWTVIVIWDSWTYGQFSPDWTEIVYVNQTQLKLYKKSASDTSTWTAITSDRPFRFVITSDWSQIYYQNITNSEYTYLKNYSDTSNWTAIDTTPREGMTLSPWDQYLTYNVTSWSSTLFTTDLLA